MIILSSYDQEIAKYLNDELNRQKNGLVMIASENFTSPAVLQTMSSVLSNKYSEGYPNARYYTGNQHIDKIEQLAIDRAKELFKAEHVNVQPHSGTTANSAVYFALLQPGDKILSLNLSHGGHLSHGSPVSSVGKLYNIVHYPLNPDTHLIDMDQVRQLAIEEKPKIIITGSTAYPRQFDFAAFDQICKEVGAFHLADIAHIVGLCIAGEHPDPIPYADIVTTTTHKTLRGPRSAMIMSKAELAKQIDKAIFPGTQGGPLEHVIAAKAVCFKQAMTDRFKQDQKQTVLNAKALATTLMENGIKVITGGTDTHLLLIDCMANDITGKKAANTLAECNIYTNFNTIPYDQRSPFDPSGLRIGTPALTTQGMKEPEMKLVGQAIADIIKDPENQARKNQITDLVKQLTTQFPIYQEIESY